MTLTPQGRQTLFEWLVRAIVLCACLPVHEFAHAYVADKLGDDTARHYGRLTLNPIRHLDLWGSLLLIFVGFGYAKPVPVDPRGFRRPKWGMALVSAAGPLSNILMSTLLLALYKVLHYTGIYNVGKAVVLFSILRLIIIVNLGLAVFNLLPIPPLDGSKLLGAFLPDRLYYRVARYERVIYLALFVLLWTGVLSAPLAYLRSQLLVWLDVVTRPVDMLFTGR